MARSYRLEEVIEREGEGSFDKYASSTRGAIGILRTKPSKANLFGPGTTLVRKRVIRFLK